MIQDYWIEFLTIAGVHLVAVASPGPDFTITLRQSLKFGSRTGIHTALGIGSGIFLHIMYSLLGLGLLISQHEYLSLGMRFLATGYLAYIGVLSLKAKPHKADELHEEHLPAPSFFATFKVGFITNALNPKATLFFLSLYVSVVSASTPYFVQGVYGVYMALATTVWFSFVAMLFGNDRVRHRFEAQMHWVERVVGVVLFILAFKLILR